MLKKRNSGRFLLQYLSVLSLIFNSWVSQQEEIMIGPLSALLEQKIAAEQRETEEWPSLSEAERKERVKQNFEGFKTQTLAMLAGASAMTLFGTTLKILLHFPDQLSSTLLAIVTLLIASPLWIAPRWNRVARKAKAYSVYYWGIKECTCTGSFGVSCMDVTSLVFRNSNN